MTLIFVHVHAGGYTLLLLYEDALGYLLAVPDRLKIFLTTQTEMNVGYLPY